MKDEMQKAYNEVDKHVQETEKLQEENRTLDEIRKVNEILIEKMSNNKIESSNESVQILEDEDEDTEREDMDDAYTDDEEVATYFNESKKNKTKRTSPQYEAEAESPKNQNTREPRLRCTKCAHKATNKAQLNKHMEESHVEIKNKCDKCKFEGNSRTDLAWHVEATHKREENKGRNQFQGDGRQVCKFWMRGFCRFQEHECRFKHQGVQSCVYGDFCTYWPNCRYSHSYQGSTNMCRYQNQCRRTNCQFDHMETNFLDNGWGVPERNFQNFPPLRSQEAPWRPW